MIASAAPNLTRSEIARLNQRFERCDPQEILAWTAANFPQNLVLTCSFQHEGVVLAHMLRSIKPDIPVLFINTRFHFEETLAYRDTIKKLLELNLVEVQSNLPLEDFTVRSGEGPGEKPPADCCRISKVGPLLGALEGVRAWINGRRRDQTPERRRIGHIEPQGKLIKVNPLARWTSKDTFRYLSAHGLPLHPLFERGYTSIGCRPCTAPPIPGEDERSGRWSGASKRECGIHTVLDSATPRRNGD